ncbi:hypothetical protein [Pontixanthobacter aquaemixtae]|uniref:Tetracyclin repressor-like C-terminal domain-containing protein n=1 Tax=Pontixanthobacter aquaemixtae TaxID=1958940 RepID=A0A844ZTK5_9SPHN|nr:hypothetical protein [Pontixanthobacter aquaemixtae]MXO91641.1 hypothetical protein [Pontixanthobacter aquaemixtae]
MTQDDLQEERGGLVRLAMRLIERRGSEVSRAILASEAEIARSRIDAIFPEEDDLFQAILEDWYAPDIAIMEEVIESDLPIQRKFYEFFARRFAREMDRYRQDPAQFALYVELGTARLEQVRGYIDLADHYMSILVAEAQAEGFFADLKIDQAMSLINQMVICYTSPQVMMMLGDRLTEEKLGQIIDTLFAGLTAKKGGARGVASLKLA